MAIRPPDKALVPPPAPEGVRPGRKPGKDQAFADALAAALREGEGAPETAVELYRLERMRGALEQLGEPGPQPYSPDARLRGLLESLTREPAGTAPSGDPHSPGEGTREVPVGPEDVVARAAQRYALAPELLRAVIRAESGSDPRAVSPAGAKGLMQLMPETARALGVSDPFDPEQNVMAGARYLRELLDRYHGHLDSALAAYNWGPGNLDRTGGEPPRETRTYVARVRRLMDRA